MRLRGAVDVERLEQALSSVIAKHEALRTELRDAGGVPCQWIRPGQEAQVTLKISRVAAEELPTALREELHKPFNLACDLPIRARLFAVDDEHILLVVIHHVACDGASAAPFWQDLTTAYNGEPLQELSIQYADFALWQREILEPATDPYGILRRGSKYWSHTLAGMPDVINLPTDRPRRVARSITGETIPLLINSELHTHLTTYARAHSTTVFTVVHTALTMTLARCGAGPDVVVGAVVSGRQNRSLDDLVGIFANTVVLRVNTCGADTFEQLLHRARETDLEALAHQEIPIEHVVEIVNPIRSFTHTRWSR